MSGDLRTYGDDTIAAIATPLGNGGIAVIRLSGSEALAVTDRVFRGRRAGTRMSTSPTHTVHYGHVVRPSDGETVDEVLVTVMRAPASYTREDVVEIGCHGGTAAVKAVLTLVLEQGARLAEPGEFTRRAFLNGRIDLTQAEAVLDMIQARTETFLRVSAHQLQGDLRRTLEALRSALMEVYADLEAVINFPEEDIPDSPSWAARAAPAVTRIRTDIEALAASGDQGRILRDGIKVVLCGKPNVGKSSLLNMFLRQPRAIVSAIAGTTRDTIEEYAQVRGVPLHFVDTAGVLEPRDVIEEQAVDRSRRHICSADLVLLVLDASVPFSAQDRQVLAWAQGQPVLAVWNKSDLARPSALWWAGVEESFRTLLRSFPSVEVSALQRTGAEDLETAMLAAVGQDRGMEGDRLLISNLRHLEALRDGAASLARAQALLDEQASPEFVSEDIKTAVRHLDRITGRDLDGDLLDQIFARFCVGK